MKALLILTLLTLLSACGGDSKKSDPPYVNIHHLNSKTLALEVASEVASAANDSRDDEYKNFSGDIGDLYAPLTLRYDSIELSAESIPQGLPIRFSVSADIHHANPDNDDRFNEASFYLYLIPEDAEVFSFDAYTEQLFYPPDGFVENSPSWPDQLDNEFEVYFDDGNEVIPAGQYRVLLMPAQMLFKAYDLTKDDRQLIAEDFGLTSFQDLPKLTIVENTGEFDLEIIAANTNLDQDWIDAADCDSGDCNGNTIPTVVITETTDGSVVDESTSELTGISITAEYLLHGREPDNKNITLYLEGMIDGQWQRLNFIDVDGDDDVEKCIDTDDTKDDCSEHAISSISTVIDGPAIGFHPVLSNSQINSLFNETNVMTLKGSNLSNIRQAQLKLRVTATRDDGRDIADVDSGNNSSVIDVNFYISKTPDALQENSIKASLLSLESSELSAEQIDEFINEAYRWEYTKKLWSFDKDVVKDTKRSVFGRHWKFRGWATSSGTALLGFEMYPLAEIANDGIDSNALVKNTWAQVDATAYGRVGLMGKNYTVFDAKGTFTADMAKGLSFNISAKNRDGVLFSMVRKEFRPQAKQANLPELNVSGVANPFSLSASRLGFTSDKKGQPNSNYKSSKSSASWAANIPGNYTYRLPSRTLVLPAPERIRLSSLRYKLEKPLVSKSMSVGFMPIHFEATARAEADILKTKDGKRMSFEFSPPSITSVDDFKPSMEFGIDPGDLLRVEAKGDVEVFLGFSQKLGPSWLRAGLNTWAKASSHITLVDNAVTLDKAEFSVTPTLAKFDTEISNNLELLHARADMSARLHIYADYDIFIKSGTLELINKRYKKKIINTTLFKDNSSYGVLRHPWSLQ